MSSTTLGDHIRKFGCLFFCLFGLGLVLVGFLVDFVGGGFGAL